MKNVLTNKCTISMKFMTLNESLDFNAVIIEVAKVITNHQIDLPS